MQEQEKHLTERLLYPFFCRKCGDDYCTDSEEHAKKLLASRWRCNTCVSSWL